MKLTLPPITPGLWAEYTMQSNSGRTIRGRFVHVVHQDSVSRVAEVPTENAADQKAIIALPDLLEALLLAHDFLEDLRTSNPGYLAKLALQDYGRLNDLGKIPAALRKAGCTETSTAGGSGK